MDVPFISHEDPLPPYKEPVGRWYKPYEGGEGEWAVHLRGELSTVAKEFGLRERLVAGSHSELSRKMRVQDEMYERFKDAQDRQVPSWSHRA